MSEGELRHKRGASPYDALFTVLAPQALRIAYVLECSLCASGCLPGPSREGQALIFPRNGSPRVCSSGGISRR
jgi:hypothetical protein